MTHSLTLEQEQHVRRKWRDAMDIKGTEARLVGGWIDMAGYYATAEIRVQPPVAPAMTTKQLDIIDAACEVAAFSKQNAYPQEGTPLFFDFAQKLDALATAINAEYPNFKL